MKSNLTMPPTEFLPPVHAPDREFLEHVAKLREYVTTAIIQSCGVPAEALNKEARSAIYERAVQIISKDEVIRNIVASPPRAGITAATSTAPTGGEVHRVCEPGGSGQPLSKTHRGNSATGLVVDDPARPATTDDDCGGYCAPC